MHSETQPLKDLWAYADKYMRDPDIKEKLRLTGYTYSIHEKFTKILADNVIEHAQNPHHELRPVILPLQIFLSRMIDHKKSIIKNLEAEKESLMPNVIVLFKNKAANPMMESIKKENTDAIELLEKTVETYQSVFTLTTTVLESAYFQQRDPAISERSLHYLI